MQSVLIVDDNTQNLYYLEVLLQGNGFTTLTAANGAEALESARNNPPNLIISDILMPVMDGYALCLEWKADERLKHIPFIFYTATFTEQKDEVLAISMGGDRFLVKPQEPDALMGVIHEVLSESRTGTINLPPDSIASEFEILREYNEALVRKLEKKMCDLERLNRDLAESEQYFRHFVMECPLPLGICGLDGTIWLLNRKFVDKFGYAAEEIRTVESWSLLAYPDPDYRREVSARWQEALDSLDKHGGTIQPVIEAAVTCRDGSVRTIEISGSAVLNRLMVVFNDITERKQAARELQRHNDELEERVCQRTAELEAKVAELDAFTSAVSHDLRAPLRRLSSYSQLLLEDLEGRLEDVDARILHKLARTSDEATEIINALLELSRLGKTAVVREAVDLSALALDILADLAAGEPGRCHLFDVAAGLKADADPQLVRIVLTNLLGNAWKYCANREETRISLTMTTGEGGREFCVSDNGAGFDMQYADKLFIPFQRLHGHEEFAGIGLGLATVSSIVHRHGGRIRAESEPGNGAKFCFTLEHDFAVAADTAAE